MQSLSEMVKTRRLGLAGHVLRQTKSGLDTGRQKNIRSKTTKDLAYDICRHDVEVT